jgi:hypothetical protein
VYLLDLSPVARDRRLGLGQTFEKDFRKLGGFSAIEIRIEIWVGLHRKSAELIESWVELIES